MLAENTLPNRTLPNLTLDTYEIDRLIRRSQRGDTHAWDTLQGALRKRVYGAILSFCRHRELTEDLTQDTFLKAWGAIQTYRGTGDKFLSWLIRIGKNAFLDHRRRNRLNPLSLDTFLPTRSARMDERLADRNEAIQVEINGSTGALEKTTIEIVDRREWTNPEMAFALTDLTDRVEYELKGLCRAQADAIRQRYQGGFSFEEIADQLEAAGVECVTGVTVRTRVQRGRKLLEQRMADYLKV